MPAALPPDLPLDALKQETFEAIHKLVAAESRRTPVVMIVEDLHWIDEASQELLEMAVARLMRARVMILVSHRPEHRPAWRTSAALTQVTLRPLLDEDVIQITRALAGGAAARASSSSASSPRRRAARSSPRRSPARSARRATSPRDGDGARLTRPVDEILIPGLGARGDRGAARPARRRRQAHGAGRRRARPPVPPRRARRSCWRPKSVDVDRELAELTRRGVIHRKSLFSDDEYRFGESLTQEVAYDSLLLKQRRQLHERVAGAARGRRRRPVAGPPVADRASLRAERQPRQGGRDAAARRAPRPSACRRSAAPSISTARRGSIGEAALRERDGGDPRFRRWVMEATLGYARLTVLYGSSADPDAERAALRGRELALELGDQSVRDHAAHHARHAAHRRSRSASREGITLTEQGIEEARQAGNTLQVLSFSRAVVWHYLLDGRFADAPGQGRLAARRARAPSASAPTPSDLYLATRWMHDGVRFYSDDLDGALRGATRDLRARAWTLPNRTVQSGAASTLAQIHFARANYADARAVGRAQPDDRPRRSATSPASIAALALLLAARVALGEPINFARHAETIESGVAQGGNVLLSIHVLVETLLGLGDVASAEKLARAGRRARGRPPARAVRRARPRRGGDPARAVAVGRGRAQSRARPGDRRRHRHALGSRAWR